MPACLLLLLLLPAGCFSSDEGEALKKDVAQLKRRISSDIDRAEQERKALQKVMEQATALLTRNSADVGAQVERLQDQNSRLLGQIEELSKSVADLNQNFSQLQAKVEVNSETSQAATAPHPPQDKDSLYRTAKQQLAAGDHVAARKLLRQFIGSFSSDPRAPGAQLLLGDSYYVQQKLAPAIVEYRKVLENHKQSPAEAEALYKIGMSFYQLKFCTDARSFLNQYLQRFRKHKNAANARKLLNLIRRYRHNREFCSS